MFEKITDLHVLFRASLSDLLRTSYGGGAEKSEGDAVEIRKNYMEGFDEVG